MTTFSAFKGINNVLPEAKMADADLAAATNVNIGMAGELSRRDGFTLGTQAGAHHNVFEAPAGFLLATLDGNLVSRAADGTYTVLLDAMDNDRIWYAALPDGRVAFSNGLINGLVAANGLSATEWGVPIPADDGATTDVVGELLPGTYQYQLTYVRLVDSQEGPPLYADPFTVTQGGVLFTGLPVLAGYGIRVYLSSVNGGDAFLLGMTTGASFSFTGPNKILTSPCLTNNLAPAPAGRLLATWRGRVLMALGDVLIASQMFRPELFDLRADYKRFPDVITLVQPVDGGIWVGTTKRLYFLAGSEFAGLSQSEKLPGAVLLGSGVSAPGELVSTGQGAGAGQAMLAIVGGVIVAGFGDGGLALLSESRYKAAGASEVWATFRKLGEIPQYMAVPV